VDNQRNLIIAVVLTGLLLFGWDIGMRYYYPPVPKPAVSQNAPTATPASEAAPTRTREGGLTSASDIAAEARDLKSALAGTNRVAIAAPGLTGSISLTGGLIDDLSAVRHTASIEKNSGPQRIFSPLGTPAQHFAQFGWTGQNVELPNAGTLWTVPAGAKLTPQTPVALTWTNSTGQTFTLTYAIDADYMITATQAVANRAAAPVTVEPFALINRTDKTASIDSYNVHAGPFGAFDQAVAFVPDYDDLAEAGKIVPEGKTDWIGFTDVYWMSTLIPDKAKTESSFRSLGKNAFRADLIYDSASIAPGQQTSRTTRLFAGAKESQVLDRYEASGIANFGLAIDWGWFRWFEKPIFWLLKQLFSFAGNFGVAIMLLTLIVRGLMFPVAQKQFASMAAMRAIQPKMKAIQERWKDDKQKQQQEVMELYKREKVNPLAGCLPIFLQIPIFFALYKVLIVAVEMRHQPFALWIKDLSAPDPLHILNLFGYLDFTPPAFLGIGVLAVLLGVTMWAQSGFARSGPAAGLLDHAVDDDVHHGAVRRRDAALLDHLEPADHRPAEVPLFAASPAQGPG
jgi:YidC/Oxa1 family membrane protein insertase